MQTLASHLLGRQVALPEPDERLIEVEPGAKVLCHCNWQKDRQKALTLLIIHGLEGSSESGYACGIAQKALAQGMNVVRMNQRNCGGTDNLSPTLYHSGRSGDLAAVAQALIQEDGVERFALVGYSMGGNLVLKLSGELGSQTPPWLHVVAAVCPAMNLAASADALHLPSNRLYELYFLRKLSRRLREKARLFPGVFDVNRLDGIKSLREFDDRVTAYYCGFEGAEDYYTRSSAAQFVDRITVPTLILQAATDPFIRILPETRQKIAANSHITFVEAVDGGHCSFLSARNNGCDGYWAEDRVVEFLGEA